MEIPRDVQNLIAEKSFSVAYKAGNLRVANKIRREQPVFLQFRFPVVPEGMDGIDELEEDEYEDDNFFKSSEIDVAFDGSHWKYSTNHGCEKWLLIKNEKVFKKQLLKVLNWAIISSQSKRSDTHVHMKVLLSYMNDKRERSMKLKDYRECSGIKMDELEELLKLYIECPDTLLPVNMSNKTYFVKSCGSDEKYHIRNRHLMIYKENDTVYTAEIFPIDYQFYFWKKHFALHSVDSNEEDFIMFDGQKMVHPLKYSYGDCVELLYDFKIHHACKKD